MKKQKILLDIENEEKDITLGLVRLVKEIADYELFFHINALNALNFTRIKDFIPEKSFHKHYFPRFQAFDAESQICIQFIANKSTQFLQKKTSMELFADGQETTYLLPEFKDVDYLIWTSEPFDDFSVILLPENFVFQIQSLLLNSNEDLYQIIQYYA